MTDIDSASSKPFQETFSGDYIQSPACGKIDNSGRVIHLSVRVDPIGF